jgi:hypothetical protein
MCPQQIDESEDAERKHMRKHAPITITVVALIAMALKLFLR